MGGEDAEYSDVLIIGAGISGIGAAYRSHEENPGLSYTVLERRERIGGTWDLFRYSGARSDSDIFTLSFPYEPWTRPENVADGVDIRAYLTETAHKSGIDEHIRFNTRVIAADWDSAADTWTVQTGQDGPVQAIRKLLPLRPAHVVGRLFNTTFTMLIYVVARKAPRVSRLLLRARAKKSLPDSYPVDIHFKPQDRFVYQEHMLEDIPNMAWCVGYINASWSLRADLTARSVAKVLVYRDSHGYTHVYPHLGDKPMAEKPAWNINAGHVRRGAHVLPKSGTHRPWNVRHNYVLDVIDHHFDRIEESMVCGRAEVREAARSA